jgi:Integrase core domain
MRRIDQLFTAWPFLGSRRLTAMLGAHSDRARLSLSGGDHRLGQPCGPVVAAVEHDGRLLLHRCLEEALAKYGAPKIFNTDQGSQFTSTTFTGVLVAAGIAISMDGRGRWMDNVFIERLWRSLKHEDIYLKGYADGGEARAGIAAWMEFYNHGRLHQALGYGLARRHG